MTPQEINNIKDKAARDMKINGVEGFDFLLREAVGSKVGYIQALNSIIDRAIELASKREIKVPSKEEIESVAKGYDNSMSSMAESIWMPQGFKEGVSWAIERIGELNK